MIMDLSDTPLHRFYARVRMHEVNERRQSSVAGGDVVKFRSSM